MVRDFVSILVIVENQVNSAGTEARLQRQEKNQLQRHGSEDPPLQRWLRGQRPPGSKTVALRYKYGLGITNSGPLDYEMVA